jgi:type II secretory pathway pseudopilin PulG
MTIIPKILGQHPKLRREKTLPADAFTLLEIVVAMAIFFMAYFSIMELLNTNLRAARSLNVTQVDFTQVVYDMLATNRLEEISDRAILAICIRAGPGPGKLTKSAPTVFSRWTWRSITRAPSGDGIRPT